VKYLWQEIIRADEASQVWIKKSRKKLPAEEARQLTNEVPRTNLHLMKLEKLEEREDVEVDPADCKHNLKSAVTKKPHNEAFLL
jgi:hypothetical protein